MHEMTKMQQQTQQEMAKIHEALHNLSQIVQESIQKNHGNTSGGGGGGDSESASGGGSRADSIPRDDSVYPD